MAGFGDLAGGLSSIGNAVSDLFGSQGASAAAGSYREASAIAAQNEELAQQATKIQETQTSRQIYQTISKQEAQVAGSGFAESGSALDLLRSSQSQGALTKALLQEQGDITANAYSEQAGLYAGLAGSASASATGQGVAGAIQGVGGLISVGSAIYGAVSNPGNAAAAGAGATAGGTDILSTAVDDFIAAISWVVCTELHRQKRLPTRWYIPGARRFASYGPQVKRGYYAWAIAATRHLRAKPYSRLSRALEWIFNHRAEYIAAEAGVRGARKTWRGLLTLAGAYGVSWLIGCFAGERDWAVLYREKA